MPRKRSGHHHYRLLSGLLIVVLLGSYVGFALSRPLPALALTSQLPTIPAASSSPLSWPPFGEVAIGAAGYGVLASNGPQAALPTASTIKILTALTVLKLKPMNLPDQGPTLTLDQTDVGYYNTFVAQDGSVVPVVVGEQITEYQALQALLLPSANNIADSLARWSAGSIDTFISTANSYAQQLGLSSVVMTDPSGLLATTVATPSDLVGLGTVGLQQPAIAQIVAQTTATIPVAGAIYNVNALLGHSGTIGIKTGNNDADPGAYVFAARQPVGSTTVTIIGAIMGGPNLAATLTASLPLITSATKNFSQQTLLTTGQQVGYYTVPWQGHVPVVATTSISQLRWGGQTSKLQVTGQSLQAGVAKTSVVGSIRVNNGDKTATAKSNLVLSQPITKPSLLWRLRHAWH